MFTHNFVEKYELEEKIENDCRYYSIPCDSDRKWVPATAKIEGETLIVSAESVPNPVAVRYAWRMAPSAALFNGSGLPAAPFRTDIWPELSRNSK